MSQPEPTNSQYVRRVVLPSGRSIEVVYFDNLAHTAATEPAPHRRDDALVDLHVCPSCDRGLVYPVEWEQASSAHWEVLLRCPNCEWTDVGVFDQDTVDRFDDELDQGLDALLRDLKRLTAANMEDEAERFAAALSAGAILPEDF